MIITSTFYLFYYFLILQILNIIEDFTHIRHKVFDMEYISNDFLRFISKYSSVIALYSGIVKNKHQISIIDNII